MTYEELIKSVSLIIENENISKKGLTLVYELDSKNHKQMNEVLFYLDKNNLNSPPPPKSDEFEVELGGLLIKFVKTMSK